MTQKTAAPAAQTPQHDVIIIGAGFSGLGMAIALKKAGRNNFLILEKAADIGGTWRDNHYPGAACDVPSHMYSYSFERNPNWSRMYSGQAEILAYIKHCARKYHLLPHFRGSCEVLELRWDNANDLWHVHTAVGEHLTARVVVSGIGALSRPAIPKVPGLDTATVPTWHSARWNHDIDLTGKRVAVIGTGASAIQFVPEIAPKVKALTVFMRTPPWIIPKPDGPIHKSIQTVLKYVPGAQSVFRNGIYWQAETFALGFINPRFMGFIKRLALSYLDKSIKDPELKRRMTPDYTPGCKRVLFSNNYFKAIIRSNVQVWGGVQEVRGNQVIDADGRAVEVDAVILGTGFDTLDPFGPLKVYNSEGVEIREALEGRFMNYKGIAIEKMPNYFMLLGPNTGLGHNSIIFMIEAQINYVMQALALMDRRRATRMEVRHEAVQAFMGKISASLKKMVWNAGGCKSWYLNEKGENFTIWPGFTWRYWMETRRLVTRDYELKKAA